MRDPLTPDWLAEQLARHPSLRISGGPIKRAAVALVFDPDLNLLFIRRSHRDGDPWSGHMALPGGRVDPGDDGPRAAALRETAEEVGVDLHQAAFVAPLDELASPVRSGTHRLVISPFVWQLPGRVETHPNHEVARVYWFHLSRFLRGEGRGTFPFTWKGATVPMPVIQLGDADIWGLTLRILEDLLRRLHTTGAPTLPG